MEQRNEKLKGKNGAFRLEGGREKQRKKNLELLEAFGQSKEMEEPKQRRKAAIKIEQGRFVRRVAGTTSPHPPIIRSLF